MPPCHADAVFVMIFTPLFCYFRYAAVYAHDFFAAFDAIAADMRFITLTEHYLPPTPCHHVISLPPVTTVLHVTRLVITTNEPDAHYYATLQRFAAYYKIAIKMDTSTRAYTVVACHISLIILPRDMPLPQRYMLV